ncbi:Protein of unknown function [Bacillus mycoides]|nr:Protein of unknown function [Bacillus mycoides]
MMQQLIGMSTLKKGILTLY